MKNIYLLLIALFFSSGIQAQIDKKIEKKLQECENLYNKKLYESALNTIKIIRPADLKILNYWRGKCDLALSNYKGAQNELINIVDKGVFNYKHNINAVPFDSYILLAQSLRRQNKINKALDVLYKAKIRSKGNQLWQDKINQEISICSKASELQKIPLKSKVILQKELSSSKNEMNIVIGAAGKEKIVYTYNELDDELIIDKKEINTSLPELPKMAIITGQTSDGHAILWQLKGDIYLQEFKNGKWLKEEELRAPINSNYIERDAVFSADGKTVYFSSNRRNSYGGFDIYKVSRSFDNIWGQVIHLGQNVNTISDEITPFFHYDMQNLYFSSNRKGTMGGYDIFKCKLGENQKFSYPENLGYPINSTADDFSFKTQASGSDAFFISNRTKGMGQADVYYVNIIPENSVDNLVLMIGTAKFADDAPIKNVQISISNKQSEELIGVFLPNVVTGRFLFLLPPGDNYEALYEAEGYLSYINTFSVPQDSAYYKIRRGIEMDPVIFYNPPSMLKNRKTIVHDIFFETNSTDIKYDYRKELDKLAEYLKKNPTAVIEIAAYSDNSNTNVYNLKLTNNRADKAKKYLIKKGTNPNQIIAKGYGEKNPIAKNSSSEGRKYNRRIEFTLKKKGTYKIQIQKIEVPKKMREK